MGRVNRLGVSLTLLGLLAGTALAHDDVAGHDHGNDDLKRAVDELRDTVRQQADRIAELEAGQRDQHGAIDESIARYLGNVGEKGLPPVPVQLRSKKGSKLSIYGFLRLDVQRDDSHPNNTQVIGWILSEDPAAVTAGVGSRKNRDDLTIHPRLTRLGVDFDGGTVASLDGARVTGKVEVDFYGGGSESRALFRMRKGYIQLAWDDLSLLFGQTTDLISPLYPAVNNDNVMWGAGNLGDRRPQILGTYTLKGSDDSVIVLQGMAGLTSAVDAANLDADPFRDGESSGEPMLQARAAYRTPMNGGNLEFGVWGHHAHEELGIKVAGHREFDSRGIGFDLTIPVTSEFLVQMEGWKGRNLDDVRGGIFQGVNTTNGDEVESQGGWIEGSYKLSKTTSFHAGWALDNPRNHDLAVGGREKNKVWYVAVRLNYDPITLGFEYLDWTTEFRGFRDGTNHRVDAFVSYAF